tara:strand:+ start:434 stop:634 length:201 start_codon:yes stop_codon:yes gene_type:complete
MKKGKWNVSSPIVAWIMVRRDLEERIKGNIKRRTDAKGNINRTSGEGCRRKIDWERNKVNYFFLSS